jgi:hypothetical protein
MTIDPKEKSDLHRHAVAMGINVGRNLGKLEESIKDMHAILANDREFDDHVRDMTRHARALLRSIELLHVIDTERVLKKKT